MGFQWSVVIIMTALGVLCNGEDHRRPVPRGAEPGECITLNNLSGTCKTIKNCFTLKGLSKNSSTELLSSSKCGNKNENICCVQCGKLANQKARVKRVVGGKTAEPGTWPSVVAVGYIKKNNPNINYLCAGNIIADQWILTGAVCVSNIGNYTVNRVKVGVLDISPTTKNVKSLQDIPVDKIIPHPSFSTKNGGVQGDIALLRLKYPIKFNSDALPICIADREEFKKKDYFANKVAQIAGWGGPNFREAKEQRLQEAEVTVLSQEECKKKYSDTKGGPVIDDKMLCAWADGKDACQGDTGAPLALEIEDHRYLIGIVSFGIGCAESYPGVYTNVIHYSDWISKEISSNS